MKRSPMTAIALTAAMMGLGACSHFMPAQQQPPQYASLTRSLVVTDMEGRRYGTIEMDPVAGGRMYDVEGRLVGTIVQPQYAQ